MLCDATELEVLHTLEQPEQLFRLWVVIEPGTFQREEQFVGGFERGEAACFGLLLDDVTARGRVGEHDARQFLETGARTPEVPNQPPRCIQQKHHQAAAAEVRRLQFSFGEIARAVSWIQQDRIVIRIVDQGLDRLVIVEGDAHVDFTVGEAKMSEPARRGFHALELIGMHEKHESRPRQHRRD